MILAWAVNSVQQRKKTLGCQTVSQRYRCCMGEGSLPMQSEVRALASGMLRSSNLKTTDAKRRKVACIGTEFEQKTENYRCKV